MAETDDWQLGDACVARSLAMYPDHDRRVGMRSGMMDAAHLCDLIADEIMRGGRASKERTALAAVAKRCGDAIEATRERVKVCMADDQIDYEAGDLDDIVINDVAMFRMERMGNGEFWLRCYRDGKPDVVFWLRSKRKIEGRHEWDASRIVPQV